MKEINADHISSLILLAGISGAGKSKALDFLSDMGFFTIDNLPVPLLAQFIEFSKAAPSKYSRTALLLDIDSRDKLQEFMGLLKHFKRDQNNIYLVFLDASTETIISRYSETRRPHPGFDPKRDQTLQDTIQRERTRLLPFKEVANFVLSTSTLTVHDLKRELGAFIDTLAPGLAKSVRVNFLSFGFKYGLPPDCDLVIDVRFLPNPHFVERLREKNGLDREVADYVLNSDPAREFTNRYSDLLNFLLPLYVFEGKSYINIGVGCTGGQHRSIAIAEALFKMIKHDNYLVSVKHRDIDR